MLDYSVVRDLYKNADRVQSQHQVIAEWNMNKYIPIKEYGIYKDTASITTYTENDTVNTLSGKNYLVYDDGSKEVSPDQEYFSDLASVFKPNRPDPGIILLQKFGNMVFCQSASNTKITNMSTNIARYYPVSTNRRYDYFNSAKLMDVDPFAAGEKNFNAYAQAKYGISDPYTGLIENANPFIVYEAPSVPCNKITIKLQNHLCVPKNFEVEILLGTEWTSIYLSTSSADFSTGILNLYYNGSGWTKTVTRITDIYQLSSSTPTQLKKINGIRFKVKQLTTVSRRNYESGQTDRKKYGESPASLELIEISPRIEVNISEYIESFNFSTSIGDSTNFGLPVGAIVSGTGAVTLSNENNQFLLSSTLSSLDMLNQDVKFSFYQKVYIPSASETYTIPLKVLYSNQWNVGEDYSVSVNLEDGMKYLRETKAPDLLFSSNAATSAIILMILDNVGITGLEFKKSSDAKEFDKEDIRIKNFLCKKEQTVAEVLEQIAIATQCSMFYDASGKLNVLTKERLTENAQSASSTGPSDLIQKTDFWFIGDENYASMSEYSYINQYTANIASLTEQKLSPITDGEINYHSYGPKKSAMADSVQKEKSKIYDQLRIDEIPMAGLAFSSYGYTSTIFWEPTQDNESVLGAANVVKDIPNKTLKQIFHPIGTEIYEAIDENDLVKQLYITTGGNSEARRSLIIYLDSNEGYTIAPFEGLVLIDKEYIRFRGKLYYLASTNPLFTGYRIIFNQDEYNQLVNGIQQGDSISFRGLVVDVKTKIVGKNDNKYQYQIISDGRAALKSKIAEHFALAEDSDGIEETNRFKLMLGETKSKNVPGELKATTQFNFLDKVRYKSGKKMLGTITPESLQSYLGFLHVSGPASPKEDTDILLSIIDPNKSSSVIEKLQKMNEQVDNEVPGNFDDYIYMQGERNIYGQKITLDFQPNAISTRMRLYSPRRRIKGQTDVMSTNSSIAGIGFGLNENNEGYFLEVESAGSGKDFVGQKEAVFNNLRFYKVQLKSQDNGKSIYQPKLLIKESVGAFTVFDTSVEVIRNDNVTTDPVFELDILIKKYANAMEYTILYGGQKIADYTEPIDEAIGVNSRNIFLFVRNDSQAIYEYMMAAARPYQTITGKNEKNWFKTYKYFDKQLEKGVIPVNKSFLFKDETGIKFYFNDFARLAREVKEYTIRFSSPAYVSTLLDISKINPKYFVKKYDATAFGAKLILVNSSGGAITLGNESNLPLYIVGIAAQEINTGTITMKDMEDTIQDDKQRVTDREKNISIYGSQTFTLDSQYIQSISHAKNIMRWVMRYCNRPRMKLSIETFANPLLEVGDKVKVFDKSRGYYIDNDKFGEKTFVISSISYSVTGAGPSMTLTLIEVGEA